MGAENLVETSVDGLPVTYAPPPDSPRGAVLWLSHLGGSREQTIPMLHRLVEAGVLAVSFDLPGHGTRTDEDPREYAAWVLASFRRRMWPLLGRATLECLRVLDWLDEDVRCPGIRMAGGVSMGGDVAVALAGVDRRIARVCSLVATPDWTRPGMCSLDTPSEVIDQGQADTYAQWFYDRLDPLTHVDAYRRDLRVRFLCGAEDTHVPADGAQRFRDALSGKAGAAEVTVDLVPGLGHLAAARDDSLYDSARDWLAGGMG